MRRELRLPLVLKNAGLILLTVAYSELSEIARMEFTNGRLWKLTSLGGTLL